MADNKLSARFRISGVTIIEGVAPLPTADAPGTLPPVIGVLVTAVPVLSPAPAGANLSPQQWPIYDLGAADFFVAGSEVSLTFTRQID